MRLDASEYQIYISGSEAININSSGSITTPSGEFNGTIGTSATATANLPAVKTAINASGSTPIYASRAWAYFDGSGTVSLINSQNISSLADRGTGLYTINFTTDMPTADFCGVAGAIPGSDPANRNRMANVQPTSSSSTSDAYVNAFDTSGNATDVDQVTVIIMA